MVNFHGIRRGNARNKSMAGAEYKHSYLESDPHRSIRIWHVHYLMAGSTYPMMVVLCDQFGNDLVARTYVNRNVHWETHDAHIALNPLRNNPDVPFFMRAAIENYIEKESARRTIRPNRNPSPSDDHDGREGSNDDV